MQKRVLRETTEIQGLFIGLPKGQDGAMTLRGDSDSTLHEVRSILAQGNELLVTVVSGRWEEHIGERVSLSFRAYGNLYSCDATIARFEEDSRVLALTMITEVAYVSLEASETIPIPVATEPAATATSSEDVAIGSWFGPKTAWAARAIVCGIGCLALIGLIALIAVAALLWQIGVS